MAERQLALLLSAALIVASSTATLRAEHEERAKTARWVSLPLQSEIPEDLLVELPGESEERWFGEFVYGTPESRRVTVVFIAGETDDFTIYVDRNRDRIIRGRDLIEGTGALRLLPLDAEQIIDDVVHKHPRDLLIQRRPGRNQIRIATATTIEHSIHPDNDEQQSQLRILQSDGNANGQFSDPKDLLMVDLNSDGRFDPFLEVFPYRPVLEARGHRWFVHGDRFGERLSLESASATGRLQLQTKLASETAAIDEFVLTVSGEDGSVFSMTAPDASLDLPVGRYAASVLFLTIQSEGAAESRSFTFSRTGGTKPSDWLEIIEGETTTLDPIGTLTLDAIAESKDSDTERVLEIQPRLFTGTGLLINSCQLGDANPWSGPQCRTTVLKSGRTIGHTSSGFA